MFNWQYILLVALGGMTGSVLRYMCYVVLDKFSYSILWPTFAVNMLGSFIFGASLAWISKAMDGHMGWRALILIGFCGGFTTFSALSFEAWELLKANQYAKLLLYYGGSAILGVVCLAAGYLIYQSSTE